VSGGEGAERATRFEHFVGQRGAPQRARDAEPAVHERDQPERELPSRDRPRRRQLRFQPGGERLDLLAQHLGVLGRGGSDLTDDGGHGAAFGQ